MTALEFRFTLPKLALACLVPLNLIRFASGPFIPISILEIPMPRTPSNAVQFIGFAFILTFGLWLAPHFNANHATPSATQAQSTEGPISILPRPTTHPYTIVPLFHPTGADTVVVLPGTEEQTDGRSGRSNAAPARDYREGSNAILLNAETGQTWIMRTDDNASNYRWLPIARTNR